MPEQADLFAATASRRPAPDVIPEADWATGRRAVPGEGPAGAPLALVGEQPGDEEDRAGRPFVGPAGRLLDQALREAEVPRERCYVTNAVKHFKFVQTARRRLHQKPGAGDIEHYRPFLLRELERIGPRLVLALGATAAEALLARKVTIGKLRGAPQDTLQGWPVLVTWHPSYLLRLPDATARAEAMAGFVQDLRLARERAGLAAPG